MLKRRSSSTSVGDCNHKQDQDQDNLEGPRSASTAFGNEAPCKEIMYNWFAKLKRDRVNLSNLSEEFRDGRPSTAVNNKKIDALRHMLKTDRYVTYYEIWVSLGKSMS
ncbi:hypothetical protein EVAR_74918_1 [Eumeta japonica]|uniref:Mos1 transposase HTH domain-containing protein n=1 Tax=Eumeta variegata TaxID=151549 RepID=A0A4C1UJM0_EUMVA|nr:hypothetical protein EVAR_74918_1 [Eumeta japonica]